MDLNVPMIDWVTFTSWDHEVYNAWREWQNHEEGEIQTGKIRMYDGSWKGSSFIGMGLQGESNHAMARISGSESHRAFNELVKIGEAKCTRLDVQITTFIQIDYSARKLVDDLRGCQSGEYSRSVRLIENDDGLDTVYIGAGSSDRFARIYVKQADEKKYLRFEVEHKREWAETVAKKYKLGEITLAGVLVNFIDTIGSNDTQGVIAMFYDLLDGVKAGLVLPSRVHDDDKTMDWIFDQVTPAMIRLLADHDKGPYLANHLRVLVEKYFKG